MSSDVPPLKVDAALNIFAKPYQTALSVLSLLRWSGRHIDRIHMQFESKGSRYDSAPPYAVAEYLGDRAVVTQPEIWLKRDPVAPARLADHGYRMSIRYQHAFEHTNKRFLFVLHNDVYFLKDIVAAMLERVDGAFAIGGLGQCWNCPASSAEVVQAAGLGETACSPARYTEFQPNFEELSRLYAAAKEKGFPARAYADGWGTEYTAAEPAWPLPECRVSEWACLVDVKQTRAHTAPEGPVMPFGAFEACGDLIYDTAVAWFRDLNRLGLRARHMGLGGYMRHWVGHNRMTEQRYAEAEGWARRILEKEYAEFADWCRKRGNGLFV